MGTLHQLGKLQGAELKIAEMKLALSGQSLGHISASLQAVAKTALVDTKCIQSTRTRPDWKRSIHYAGCLVDSNAPKFRASDFAPKFLNGLCPIFLA